MKCAKDMKGREKRKRVFEQGGNRGNGGRGKSFGHRRHRRHKNALMVQSAETERLMFLSFVFLSKELNHKRYETHESKEWRLKEEGQRVWD